MNLDVEEGSFVTLLGPSGCGKTTTLRMIAGLVDPTEGDILIRGRNVTGIPVHKRNLGLVFQNYALFPHKTVYENVAFGLKHHGTPRAEIGGKVRKALELVQLPDVGDRHPRQLSGGQQQRIALARAIVIEPDVLLLDEPLSALDANLRENMRVELKRIQSVLGITTIFVTHDQSEALAMSDTIVLMNEGRIEQVGPPEDVYVNPISAFSAGFLGNSNLLPARVTARDDSAVTIAIEGIGELAIPAGRAHGLGAGERALVVIRSEKLLLRDAGAGDVPEGAVALPAKVTALDYQGQLARYFISVAGQTMQAVNPIEIHPYREGTPVTVIIRGRDCALVRAD